MNYINRIGLIIVIAAIVVIFRDGSSIWTFLGVSVGVFMFIHSWKTSRK